MRFIRFLAFFLFLQQFAFSGDIATVALGQDVFAQRGNGLAGDDFGADGGLDGNLELLAGNQFTHLGDEEPCRARRQSRGGR